MGIKASRQNRIWVVLGMVVAGLCLVRVLTVAADEVEVYSSYEEGEERSYGSDGEYAEIRLTRPGEAEERIARDGGYELVPGAEQLKAVADGAISVPSKRGRAIASETGSNVFSGGVMEPKPIDAQQHIEDMRYANKALSPVTTRPSYGIQSEPGPKTSITPPLPPSHSRVGMQEVSLIVSDYGYFPERIFVTQGVPVKVYLTTPSKVTMCFMVDELGVRKGIVPGKVEEIVFTPTQPGDFRFYCPVRSIEGKLTVRESPLAEQSARGLASQKIHDTAGFGNAPKNAGDLRLLIED